VPPPAEPHRLAVYAAPPHHSELARRATQWLEEADGVTGIGGITDSARHYGLHATLKPPFRLAEGVGVHQVGRAVAALAAATPGAVVDALVVGTIGRFVALVPAVPSPQVDALAASCVTVLDHLRRPPSPDEVERRRAAGLSARQSELLDTWGYPFVLDEFRFHITLSCNLTDVARPAVVDAAREWFGPLDGAPFVLDELCVFAQPTPGADFAEIARHPLAPAQASPF
jgi:hypothetical protein